MYSFRGTSRVFFASATVFPACVTRDRTCVAMMAVDASVNSAPTVARAIAVCDAGGSGVVTSVGRC